MPLGGPGRIAGGETDMLAEGLPRPLGQRGRQRSVEGIAGPGGVHHVGRFRADAVARLRIAARIAFGVRHETAVGAEGHHDRAGRCQASAQPVQPLRVKHLESKRKLMA